MIQETVKTQLEQVKTLRNKVEAQVKPQLDKVSAEAKKVLSQLGANLDEQKSVKEIVSAIRSHNPTFKSFWLKLDAATYDARKRFEWNATMMSAYAKFKAEVNFEKKVKPMLESYKDAAENQVKGLVAKANELKAKVRG
ncbi:MAG: hypothetical protein H7A00_09125 [Hahellaceae bacterium]|nr:hypothetical protein [Hahellaceae bacterium]